MMKDMIIIILTLYSMMVGMVGGLALYLSNPYDNGAYKWFWKYLRENPNIIYEILKYSSSDYYTSSFNNFIINDLFGDIFHPDNISNTLYYVLEKLLESEISKLHESVFVGKISEAIKTIDVRGEFVIIVSKNVLPS